MPASKPPAPQSEKHRLQPPRSWLWRLAGVVCGLAGALGLMRHLPKLDPRLARARGLLVPAALLMAVALTTGRWFGASPILHRIPLQISIGVIVWLALTGIGKLGLPRWTLGCRCGNIHASLHYCSIHPGCCFRRREDSFPPDGPHWNGMHLVRRRRAGSRQKMASGDSRRDGDLAVAIFLGYAIGQWMPKFL